MNQKQFDLFSCNALPITRDVFELLNMETVFGSSFEPDSYALVAGWNRMNSEVEFWVFRNTSRSPIR
jgi:hypothetical protein